MNKVELVHFTMSRAVTKTLDNNSPIVVTIPGLSEALTKLKKRQADVQTHSQGQAMDTSGPTTQKNIIREQLVLLILKVCSAMLAIATNSSDTLLKMKFNFKKSDFPRMRDQDLYTTASNVYTNALPYTERVTPFATSEDIAQVKALADEFFALLPVNRTLTTQGATSTANLHDTIDSIMELITDTIDPLMKPTEFSHPDFYRDYRNARKLVDHGSRSSKSDKETPDSTAQKASK